MDRDKTVCEVFIGFENSLNLLHVTVKKFGLNICGNARNVETILISHDFPLMSSNFLR